MSDKLIKDVRKDIMRSATTTRSHEIMRNGYEPIVMRGRLCDCIKAIIHATHCLIENGYSPSDFDKYLKFVSYEYHNGHHLYIFEELPLFDVVPISQWHHD